MDDGVDGGSGGPGDGIGRSDGNEYGQYGR